MRFGASFSDGREGMLWLRFHLWTSLIIELWLLRPK